MNECRWQNVLRARDAYDSGDTRSSDSPLEAFVEVAARCNLRCAMCAINYDTRYKPRSGRPPFFEPDLFARLRPIFPTLLRGFLFGLGEPTLNPHLVDYVRELSANGAEVWFNTNATKIDQRMADALALAGADRITVSIDGATKRTFETIRRGATFESVIGGIRALVAAQRKFGRPRVDLSCVAMASNLAEMPRLVELAAELGAMTVHVEPLYSQPDSPELMEHYRRENAGAAAAGHAAEAFASAAERAKALGVHFQSRFLGLASKEFDYTARVQRVPWTCSEPWASIWVTAAGEVRTCCTNDVSFGNLFEQTFEEIWNGDLFRRFRAQHAAHAIADGCGNCIRNGRVRHSPMFRTLKPVLYEPLFPALPPAGDDDPIVTATPRARDTVHDPLEVRGRFSGDPVDWELMLDLTPVANLNDRGTFDGDAFALSVPVPFVTEGAHTTWWRRRSDDRGFAYREVFVWRK